MESLSDFDLLQELERRRECRGLGLQVGPPTCTGVAASWCPRCGDCTCRKSGLTITPDCPLHSDDSPHAEEHLAALMGEWGLANDG